MTKDELISAITGFLPYPEINCSLKAVRIAKDIYDLFEKNYKPEVITEEKLSQLFVDWRDNKLSKPNQVNDVNIGLVVDWIRESFKPEVIIIPPMPLKTGEKIVIKMVEKEPWKCSGCGETNTDFCLCL